jgi:hypothetical protein
MAGSISSNTLNIGGADPIQGFDVGVWVHDTGTKQPVMLGQFTSIVVTIRNATEAYMEFGQRYPRYLDGEFQIAFVMEKGLLDLNVFQQTFGFKYVSRTKRFGRSPRFDITFAVNPVDADVLEGSIRRDPGSESITRDATGRFILSVCKIDSWHFASTSGRQVIATQWQGVAEGFAAVTSEFSQITGLTTPGLTGGPTASTSIPGGEKTFYKSFADGIASTAIGSHLDDNISYGDSAGSYPSS